MIALKTFGLTIIALTLPFCLKQQFKIPTAQSKIAYNVAWESQAPTDEILALLHKPFTYLAHGNQATVFESEDGQYVLKLFRHTRTQFAWIHNLKTQVAKWQHKKTKDDLYTKMDKTLRAAHIAGVEAKEFTQVIFCHLNLTKNALPKVTLIGTKTLKVPLDRVRFVIQKKAQPFKKTLLAARSDPAKMHQLIDSLLSLFQIRAELGIRNSDPNLLPNFGFIGTNAIEIDFGNYRKGVQTENELLSYTLRLEKFLMKNAPEYIDYLRINNPFCTIGNNEKKCPPP